MKILGIETSCDETAAAVVEDGKRILSWAMASSVEMHAKTGGIIPEQAAREQVRAMVPTIDEALNQLEQLTGSREFDAIAVTNGPGLIGSLLIGVETAKSLAWVWNKPLIPVNHLIGHVYANYLEKPQDPILPFLTLIVSGGHTDLVLVEDHGKWRWLGGTRDDAAGEAFDKVARVLGLGFPGGPAIQQAAEHGNPTSFSLPRPMLHSGDFDFSFSGLKAAMVRVVAEQNCPPSSHSRGGGNPSETDVVQRQISDQVGNDKREEMDSEVTANLAAAFQEAVVDVLIAKTVKAAQETGAKSILLSGGVAANSRLRERLQNKSQLPVFIPEIRFCTDNGAMIAAAAYFNNNPVDWKEVQADPSLSLQ